MWDKRNKKAIYIMSLLVLTFFYSCSDRKVDELIICTQIQNGDLPIVEDELFPVQSRLVAFEEEDPQNSFRVLTSEFYSACSPDVFYTGEKMVFSGQQTKDGFWQIWEVNLRSFKLKQISNVQFNCTDPVYLPTGEIVYSGVKNTGSVESMVLFCCNPDGSDPKQITFHPHQDFNTSLLHDGRILSLSMALYPKTGPAKLMVMRPDGTKSELFYANTSAESQITGRCRENESGEILFIEKEGSSGKLVSVLYNEPIHSAKVLSHKIDAQLLSVFPLDSNKIILSLKKRQEQSYGIYTFNRESLELEDLVYSDNNYHTFEPVVNRAKKRARKLPSAVNLRNETGLLLCQDLNLSTIPVSEEHKNIHFNKIEIIGMDKSFTTVQTEKDGSVYLEMQADTPFRFQVVNDKGEIVRGPSDWLWVRPNERRGCVGCHADRELVPKNYVPLSVKKPPVKVTIGSSKTSIQN